MTQAPPVLFGPEQVSVEFDVQGDPVSQGSHSAYLRQVFVAVKSRVYCPRCRTPLRGSTEVVDKTKGLDDWREKVAWKALAAMRGRSPIRGPVLAYMDFALARPPSHYRSGRYADLLRPDAPPEPHVKPDLSKLARAAEDAMTGIVWADDCQVTEYSRLRMHYAGEKADGLPVPGVRIVVTKIG